MTIDPGDTHTARSPIGAFRRNRTLCVSVCAALSAALGACGDSGTGNPIAVVCADPVPVFSVRIRNASTGEFTASNAIVIATAGSYADTTRVAASAPDSLPAFAGYRPGKYAVVVRKNGFLEWQITGVAVPAAESPCEGNPGTQIDLDARLQPQS